MPDHDRLPPHSLDAEMGLLDCALKDTEGAEGCLDTLVERLSDAVDFFYDLRHQKLWRHFRDMHAAGEPVNQETLLIGLRLTEQNELIEHLFELDGKGPSPLNFEFHWKTCNELWRLRRQIRACSAAIEKIYSPDAETNAEQVMEQVEKDILAVRDQQETSTVVSSKALAGDILEVMDGYTRGTGLNKGLLTGFDYYDKMTTGYYGQEYHVLAGRPGTGKTSFALNLVNQICLEQGIPTVFFSLEMTKLQLGLRLISQRSWTDFQRLRTGYLKDEDMRGIAEESVVFAKAPLFIDDLGKQSILSIRSKARRLKRQHGLGFVVIDYLQLIAPAKRLFSREQEVSEVSGEILEMAKELDIPVLILAQLNRQIEQTERWRPPRLSDLRESGQVEQDAHSVTILYTPKIKPGGDDEREYEMVTDTDWSQKRLRVNASICKQRNGPTGDVEFIFWKHSMNFKSFNRGKEL